MLGGIRRARVMAGPSTAEIDDVSAKSLGIRCLGERRRPPERQHHAERDEGEVAVEQNRAVDSGERPEFLGEPLRFRQEGVAKQAAERDIGRLRRFVFTLRAAETSRQPEQRRDRRVDCHSIGRRLRHVGRTPRC